MPPRFRDGAIKRESGGDNTGSCPLVGCSRIRHIAGRGSGNPRHCHSVLFNGLTSSLSSLLSVNALLLGDSLRADEEKMAKKP